MTDFSFTPIEGAAFGTTYLPPYDPTAAISSTNDPSQQPLPFLVGARASAADGSEYVFVKASATIAVNNVLGITVSTSSTSATPVYTAAPITKALADQMAEIAVAYVAIASGSYGWAITKGANAVTLKNSCLPSVPLYTTATAGYLDDTSGSQTRIYGIRSQKTATASGAAKICWFSNMTV